MKRPPYYLLFIVFIFFVEANAQDTDRLNVLAGKNDSILYDYLLKKASVFFNERREIVKKSLTSKEALEQRQKELRTAYEKWVGKLPEKTPLNPEVTGTIEKEGILLENIVYESRPGHHVTANLFKPAKGEGPFPGIVVVCGHTTNGKAADLYQKVGILLAMNGMAAIVVDPFGQGERYQLINEDHKLASAGGTYEHTMMDFAGNLLGTDATVFELWDNIRALDYLETRKDIDPERLGVTGNSGGGNQTTFLMSWDERVKVAAPSCYIASKEAKFNTIGGQDGCQQFYSEGSVHFEENDFIILRAPKPTLVLAAQQDFFDFEGTQQVVEEVQKVYDLLDKPDQFDFYYYNDGHGYSQPRREAAVAFFAKWFLDTEYIRKKTTLPFFEESELTVVEGGQVAKFYKDEVLLQDLLMEQYDALAKSRASFLKSGGENIKKEVARQIGYTRPGAGEVSVNGSETLGDLEIEKYVINPADGVPIPGLLIKKKGAKKTKMPVTIVADSEGKSTAIDSDLVKKELEAGRAVFAADLRGFGETADAAMKNGYIRGTNREWRAARVGLFIHKPLLGQRTEDIVTIIDALSKIDGLELKDLKLTGVGLASPAALHAALLDDRIKKVADVDGLESWKLYLEDFFQREQVSNLVAEVLKYYDLPDLRELLKKKMK